MSAETKRSAFSEEAVLGDLCLTGATTSGVFLKLRKAAFREEVQLVQRTRRVEEEEMYWLRRAA